MLFAGFCSSTEYTKKASGDEELSNGLVAEFGSFRYQLLDFCLQIFRKKDFLFAHLFTYALSPTAR